MATPTTSEGSCGKCARLNAYKWFNTAYTDNIFLKAFCTTLVDPDIDLLSEPAIAARKCARCVLSWCESHKKETSDFFNKLQFQLCTCFVRHDKPSTQRERMWEAFSKIRSSNEFEEIWKQLFTDCETEASKTV